MICRAMKKYPASMDKNGMLSIKTKEGTAFIYPENKYRKEFADLMRNM